MEIIKIHIDREAAEQELRSKLAAYKADFNNVKAKKFAELIEHEEAWWCAYSETLSSYFSVSESTTLKTIEE